MARNCNFDLVLLIGSTHKYGPGETFILKVFDYDLELHKCKDFDIEINSYDLGHSIKKLKLIPINFRVKNNREIKIMLLKFNQITAIQYTLKAVRSYMEKTYGKGTELAGHCIEASEYIVAILKSLGYEQAKTVEGYCLYDNGDFCSDVPYDPHTWAELDGYYLDVTADQFNYGMIEENEFAPICIKLGLPHGIVINKPVEGKDYWF